VEWYWRGRIKELGEKPASVSLLSTANITWTDPGGNSGLRRERLATNCLSPAFLVSVQIDLSFFVSSLNSLSLLVSFSSFLTGWIHAVLYKWCDNRRGARATYYGSCPVSSCPVSHGKWSHRVRGWRGLQKLWSYSQTSHVRNMVATQEQLVHADQIYLPHVSVNSATPTAEGCYSCNNLWTVMTTGMVGSGCGLFAAGSYMGWENLTIHRILEPKERMGGAVMIHHPVHIRGVIFRPRLTLGERTPQYPLDGRLGGPQSWCGQKLEEKSFVWGGSNPGRPICSQALFVRFYIVNPVTFLTNFIVFCQTCLDFTLSWSVNYSCCIYNSRVNCLF
jgi:hypothetical protein